MVISCLYVQTITHQCFCFPNSQWGATAHDTMVRVDVQHMAKYAIDVVRRTTLRKDADRDKTQTQAGLIDVRVRVPDLTGKF